MLHLGRGRRRGSATTLVAGLTALAISVVGLTSGAASAAPRSGSQGVTAISNDLVKVKSAKVRGTFTNPETGKHGRVIAKFVPTKFVERDGGIAVEGTLKGVFTGTKLPDGTPRHFSEPVEFAVTDATSPGETSTTGFEGSAVQSGGIQAAAFTPVAADCDVLHLNLGPLDLNLLGLQIDLAEVVLDIVAQPGAGNLLGNLLCAVAGLLDPGSSLGDLLDNVIAGLNGLLTGVLDLQAVLDDLLGGLAQTQSA